MSVWTVTARQGWLRFDDQQSVTVVEADRVALFGTTLRGFVVLTSADRLYFQCPAQEARAHVETIFGMLAGN